MKKTLSLLLILILSMSILASCKLFGKDKEDGGDNVNGDDYFYASGVDLSVIFSKESEAIISDFSADLHDKLGVTPAFKSESSPAGKHEIIFGNTSRDLSKRAYQLLDRLVENDETAGYVIYSDGTSVAVAFSTDDVLDLAYSEFFKNCLNVKDGKIELKSGVIASDSFNLNEYFDKCDEELRAQQWAELEKYVNDKGYDGKATVEAFKKLYSLYSDSAYIWLANLYDPITGGFYYSNSGRETVKFAPDLESTRQALDLLRYSGMTSDLKGTLPEDMKTNLVAWVQSLQRSNGLYYHPQWDNYVTTDERLGRDVTNARAILGIFGARPNYSANNGMGGVSAASALGTPLSTSKVSAVSKVIPTASGHLASEEAFIKYLDSQNWNDSYTSGNRIAAQFTLICEAKLGDVCLDYMDKLQNPDTGMWSPDRDDNAVNGFLKISAMYSSYGRIMNYSSEAADTCIEVLRSEADPSTVCWVYNVWYSLGNIIGLLNSKKSTSEDKALAADIVDRLRKNAAEYITIAAEKYAPFRKDDGSFSFTPNYSSEKSQGMPVCVSRMNEGDVNASYISIISVPARIFAALGYTEAEVDVYTPNDYKKFLNVLEGLGEIEKTNMEWGGALAFNGDTLEGLFYGTSATELDVKASGGSEENHGYAYISEKSDKDTNRVLTFGKVEQTYFDGAYHEPRLEFRTIDGGGTRYVYEMDICFEKGYMDGNSWHTRFAMYNGSGRFWYMLCYTNSAGKLCLDSLNDPLAVLDPGKWYNLRFEYYTDSAATATGKICMVYLDGKYIGDGGTSGAAGKDSSLARCMMEFRAQSENVEWRLDNVNTTTDDTSYVTPPPPDFGDATGKYYTDATIKKTRYDYDAEDATAPILVNNNGSATTEIKDGTLIFAKAQPSVSGEDAILFKNALNDAFWKFTSKASIVEFDLNYSGITANTPMKWRFGKDIGISKSGDSLTLTYKYNGKAQAVNLGTASGKWNNIRLEQYWYKVDDQKVTYTVIKVFVNDEYRGELLTDYNSATDKFYVYLFNAEKSASIMIDNLLFAHVDKEYVQDTVIEPNPDEGGTTPPTEPETPTEPDNPTKPDNPTEPETPTDPDTPTEPETPDTPPTVTDADGKGDFYLSDKSGNRWDYDTLTEIPSDMKNYSGTTGSFSITDGALLLDDGDAENSAMAIKYYISAPASYNAAVLEFDFKLTQSYGSYPMQIKLGGATETIYYSNAYDASYGTGHKLCMLIDGKYVPLGISMNDWATVRFEHYFNEAVLKVYVNNKFVFDVPTVAGKADTATVYLTANERKTGSDANLYIDNVYSAYLTLDYFEGAPEGGEEEPKDDAKGEYYLSDDAGRRLDYDTITEIDASMKTYSGTVGSYSIVDGALLIDDGDAESSDMGMKFWLSYSSDFNNATNRCEILEFDFKLTQSYGSYPIQIKMAKQTYTIYYSKEYDASFGTGYKLCMQIDGKYVPLGISMNDWSTIRLEHYYDAAMLKVYVNNEFLFDIATNAGETGDSPRITLTSNERKTGSNADLYLDNIYVGHVLKDFVAGDPKAD